MQQRNLSRSNILLVVLILWCSSIVFGQEKYEYIPSEIVFEKLDEVGILLEKNKPEEARVRLDKIKDLIGFEKSDHYLLYPTGIIRNIRIMQSQINDAEGYYDDFAKFEGVIIEAAGIGNSGYFVVKGYDKEMAFIWEADLIIVDEQPTQVNRKHVNQEDDQHPWIGGKVTVYYDFHLLSGGKHPVKLIFH